MKTAVSLPDELFVRVDKLAKRLGIARSHLYALALTDYLERHAGDGITERLNVVYREVTADLDPSLAELQAAALGSEMSD